MNAGSPTVRALALGAALLAACAQVPAGSQNALEFSLYKRSAPVSGETALVIGGIQGDEPGGFNAASLLVTHYTVHRGNLWVVPNLNFESIVKRSRGVHGDMNRKFSAVSRNDPDFDRIEKIKRIILDEEVGFVFNLHDGSGYYRPAYKDRLHNPRRWGQSIIIDQESADTVRHGDLGQLAREVSAAVNSAIENPEHRIHVKNTRTREGDTEMEKTLTYFAINHGKAAVGLEASKELPTHMRVLYHLRLLETYMSRLGIVFERRFALTPESVRRTVDDNVKVSFFEDRIFLDMRKVRNRLGYVPFKDNAGLEFTASSPLVAITGGSAKGYRVSYGNRRMTVLHPQHFEYDETLSGVEVVVDGERRAVRVGSVVDVSGEIVVEPGDEYRVNVIGWRRRGVKNESGVAIRRTEIMDRFSVDRSATTFRVEIYRGPKFSGMFLIRFPDTTASAGRAGKEDTS